MKEESRRKIIAAQDAVSSGILGRGWPSLRKTFEAFWKKKPLVLVLFLLVSAGLGIYHYVGNLRTASTIVSLDYEEASKGLTPRRI